MSATEIIGYDSSHVLQKLELSGGKIGVSSCVLAQGTDSANALIGKVLIEAASGVPLVHSAGRLQVDAACTSAKSVTESTCFTDLLVGFDTGMEDNKSQLTDCTEIDVSGSKHLFVYGSATDTVANHGVQMWVSRTENGTEDDYYRSSQQSFYEQGGVGFRITDLACKYVKFIVTNNSATDTSFTLLVDHC